MPTYAEEVLADNPVFYARLDDSPGAEVMTDLSASGNDGEFYSDAGFGLDSPIETDAGSKAISGHVGFVQIPDESLDAFTWEAWGRHTAALSAGTLICRGGQIGLSSGNYIAIDANNASAQLTVGASSYILSYPLGANYGWYHIVLTRITNVMRLYVNGLLRAERTDLGLGSLVGFGIPPDGTNPEQYTFIGTGQLADVFASAGTDEPAIYPTALNAGRVLVHYEAALADLPLSATINVRVVVELDTDDTEPIDFPFTHNFAEPLSGSPRPIIEHLSFKTNDLRSQPDYSQRINAQPHHLQRALEYFVTPSSARARAILQSALWMPGQIYKLPIAKDWGVITAQATAGADTLTLDTTLRDYEIGSYVAVWEDIYRPWTAQIFEITSRTDSDLGITPDVGDTLPAGSTVMPARLAILPEESLSVDSHLIDRETHALQFEILSTELSPRRVTEYTPSQTYKDVEIFNLERAKVEWVDLTPYQISRRFQGTGTPTGNDYQRAIDTGSPQTIPIRLLFASREAVSEFYGWMEARQGKQNPVWIVSQEADLEVIARSNEPDTITINYIGYASRYNAHHARRYLAFLLTNGTYSYKQIASAVDNGDGTETLTLDADPPLFAGISKTSFLKFCTAPDQFELKYHRDGSGFIAECEFVFSELLTTPE